MFHVWHDMDPKRITCEKFMALIEISRGSKNKYELDKDTGLLILDRVLSTSTHYPANYGLIPRTLAGDGDPLDVLVLCQSEILPYSIVECYPIGALEMIDEGKEDVKIIAVCSNDPHYNSYHDIFELPAHIFDEIRHFYQVYKDLENKHTSTQDYKGAEQAREIIQSCMDYYEKEFGEKR